jgi:hypothetical protein
LAELGFLKQFNGLSQLLLASLEIKSTESGTATDNPMASQANKSKAGGAGSATAMIALFLLYLLPMSMLFISELAAGFASKL